MQIKPLRHAIPPTAAILALAASAASLTACAPHQPPAPTEQPVAIAPRPAAHEEVSQDSVMDFLRALPTKRSAVGNAEHLQGLRDTQDLLVSKLTDMGYTPERWPFELKPEEATFWKDRVPADEKDRQWENIVVKIDGKKHPEQIVLISAHFDAVPNSPGADDDGTGTAALLELARVIQGRDFDRSIRLVWFNGEEVGLVGSRKYALAARRAMQENRAEIVAMISVEMLGYFSDEPDSQKSPIPRIEGVFDPPTVADFIAIAGTQKYAGMLSLIETSMLEGAPGLKVVAPNFIPDLPFTPPDLLRSDHAPFLALGIPSFLLGDTANFRSPHYHQPTDTIDTIDAHRFTLCVKGLANATVRLASDAQLPKSKEDSPPAGK